MRPPSQIRGYELREDQKTIVAKILAAYEKGKRVVILQAPTGTGKSIIGRTVLSAFDTSYIIIPDKKLQDQYANDLLHTGDLATLKGKSNYVCTVYPDAPTVDEAPCQFAKKNTQIKECQEEGCCPYYSARSRAMQASHTIFNSAAYLTWMTVGAAQEEPYFPKRELHVIDEAHKIEDVVCDYLGLKHYEFQIDRLFRTLDLEVPPMPRSGTEEEAAAYLLQTSKLAEQALDHLMAEAEAANLSHLLELAMESKKLERVVMPLVSLVEKVTKLFEIGLEHYALGYGHEDPKGTFKGGYYIMAKPLNVGSYVRENVLGEYTLFMSATLPMAEEFARSVGLKEDEYEFVDVESHFPYENRPIFFTPVGRLSKGEDKKRVAEIAAKVSQILAKFPGEKGIIHTPSYAFNKLFAQQRIASGHEMLVCLSGEDSEGMLEKHIAARGNTVIVSPAMQEGVDLKDSLSRVQIIVKCPFGNLGDAAVVKKMQRNPRSYDMATLVKVLQMYGRSIRHPQDYARTYILDEDLRLFLNRVKKSVPSYVLDAIHRL